MKNAEQKARIREMLAAENGEKPDLDWKRFKAKMRGELGAYRAPELEIRAARRAAPWLMPAAALVIAGIVFFAWQKKNQTEQKNPEIAQNLPNKKTIRAGEVFRQGKKEIRFLTGTATLSDSAGKISVEAQKLAADFSLGEKTNLEIKHPLVTVQVTGTAFRFDADTAGGSIHLREGSLRVLVKSGADAEQSVILRAPTRFVFSKKGYKQVAKREKPLYRYELRDGEVLYAEQIAISRERHQVQLLGGGRQTIATADILRHEVVP